MKMMALVMGLLVGMVQGVWAQEAASEERQSVSRAGVATVVLGLFAVSSYKSYVSKKRDYNDLRSAQLSSEAMADRNIRQQRSTRNEMREMLLKTAFLSASTLVFAIVTTHEALQLRAGARGDQTGAWIEKKF